MRENPFEGIYKMTNSGTNLEKYHRIQGGEITLPLYIDVELTNVCNLKCRMCPTGTGAMHRMKGFMSDKVIEAIVKNIEDYKIPAVRFIRWGEPTIHPQYIEYMERIRQAGAIIHLNTNGCKLDEEQIGRLIDINLDSIKISFQGADAGTYGEMREGGDYSRLIEIVRLLHKMRGDKEYPYIQVSTTLTDEGKEQVEKFKEDIGDYCDYYNIGYTVLTHLNIDDMKVSPSEKERIRELQKRERNEHKYLEVCNEAFEKLSINWNGDVTLCCADYDNYMIVGNLLDNDIKQIFNSRAADIYRDAIAKKQYGRIKCCSMCYETIELAD